MAGERVYIPDFNDMIQVDTRSLYDTLMNLTNQIAELETRIETLETAG